MNTNKTKDLALHKYIYDRKRRYDFIMLNSQVEDDKGKKATIITTTLKYLSVTYAKFSVFINKIFFNYLRESQDVVTKKVAFLKNILC
jgi:hypothetical protein